MYSSRRLMAVMLSVWVMATVTESSAEPVRLYVAPTGNNGWTGELAEPNDAGNNGPLADVGAARDRLREIRSGEGLPDGAVIEIAEGQYAIEEAIRFEPIDSGTDEGPIVFRAADGAHPVIHGGRVIGGWRNEDGVWTTDIPEVRDGKWSFSALWVDGERRMPARTPNAANPWGDNPPDSDFFWTAGPVEVPNSEPGETSKSATAFRYEPEDLKQFDSLDDAVFVIFHSWATSLMRVDSLDRENQIVHFTGPARWHYGRWLDQQRYFVEHVREGLDQPGEWYLDRDTGRLSYIPMPGERIDDVEVVAPVVEQLLLLEGVPADGGFVEHLRFDGLEFRYTETAIEPEGHSDAQAAFAVNAAVEGTGARHCAFEDCTVRNVSNYGVWFRKGSQGNTVRRSELYDLGAGGVRIGEGSSPTSPSEAVERNVIDNNFIHEGGRIFRSAVGVWVGRSSHNAITHNEICDFRYTGVSVGWSWGYAESSANHNRIAYNHIHHIGLSQLNDMGGIYTLGVSPGTELVGNRIHDVISHPDLYGGWGLYTDEGSSDILLKDNIVYNTRTGGFHQHYGRDNHVVNNIFAYSHGPQIIRSREEDHNSFTFERNIVFHNNGQLLGSTWKNGNWTLDYNCYWDESGQDVTFKGRTFAEWRAEGHDVQSVIANPMFADPHNADFTLKEGSPAFELGFERIDASKAGLYGDAEWTELPKRIERPAFEPPEPNEEGARH